LLQTLFQKWRRRHPSGSVEESKAAISTVLKDSVNRCFVHLLPVATAIVFCWLNIRGWYIGEHLSGPLSDKAKLNLVQVAAKVHELMMQASIVAMVLTYIRHEARRSHGLPFGAFLGGQECTKISYLWSLPLWGAIMSPRMKSSRRKGVMIIILITATLLAAIVGPSSAIVMTPVIGEWRTSGKEGFIMDSSVDDLWPQYVGGVATPVVPSRCEAQWSPDRNLWCENPLVRYFKSFGMRDLTEVGQEAPGATDFLRGRITRRIVRFSSLKEAIFSIPPFSISDWFMSISSFWLRHREKLLTSTYRDLKLTVDTFQPSVRVSCNCEQEHYMPYSGRCDNPARILYPTHIEIPHLGDSQESSVSIPYLIEKLPLNETDKLVLTWFSIPEDTPGEPSIGAFISLPSLKQTHPDFPSTDSPAFLACAIDARWAPVSLYRVGETVLGNPEYLSPIFYNGDGKIGPVNITTPQNLSWKQVKIDQDWANSLDRLLTGRSNGAQELYGMVDGPQEPTAFQTLAEAYGRDFISERTAEQILASMVALGLSEINFNPRKAFFGHSDRSSDYKLQMNVVITGYNYHVSNDPKTMSLAIAILLVYCTIAVSYVMFMVGWYRESSNSWDCSAEVTTLAINSRTTELLQGTCAGIENIETFSLNLRIVDIPANRATEEEIGGEYRRGSQELGHLELQFSAEKGKWDEDFRPIRNNETYS
jgi:hypothetical protein